LVTTRAGDNQENCPNYDRKTTNSCQERLPSAMKNCALNLRFWAACISRDPDLSSHDQDLSSEDDDAVL